MPDRGSLRRTAWQLAVRMPFRLGRYVRGIRRGARRARNPAAANDLLHRMHARHAYDFRGFNAGILVLDLARLRADRFGREFLGFVERYGMNDQEVLNCYAGPHRAELPAQWNAWPAQGTGNGNRVASYKPEYAAK